MGIYTHAGPIVPRAGVELFQERIEQQLAWEDQFYGSESHYWEESENEALPDLRDAWSGEIDLGGIMAQCLRDL